MTDQDVKNYYGSQSYNSNKICKQPTALRHKSFFSSQTRLAWGSTHSLTPLNFMELFTPESMRLETQNCTAKKNRFSREHATLTRVNGELRDKYDHQCIRFAQLPFRSRFWIYIFQGGKWTFLLFTPLYAAVCLMLHIASRDYYVRADFSETFFGGATFISLPPLLCWFVGHIVINHFPTFWFRPPKGPLWELNRRTGLVTIFDYRRFRKEGVIKEFVAPFYEFDAYMITARDRHGSSYGLLLRHRYEDQLINFHTLLRPDDFKQRPCALWDFFQNYMDVSLPLPDIPLFEPHRHLDPVTAEYDRKHDRNPRYWIEMDDDAFKTEVNAMWKRIYEINTFGRPNLMARYVDYSDQR